VFGCGSVGMSAIMAAKIAGCEKIIAVGGNIKSLGLALELGATHAINRRQCGDIISRLKEITGGGLQYAIDTSGVSDIIRTALKSLHTGGTAAVVGASGEIKLHIPSEIMNKSLIGVVEGDAVSKLFIPKLLKYYKTGRFPFDRLITYFDFSEINRAASQSLSGEVIKAVLRF